MKGHIYGMLVSVIFAFIGLGIIITTTDPYTAESSLRLLFFAASFVLLWGLAALGMTFLSYRFGKKKPSEKTLIKFYVIGFFFAMITVGLIALNIWM